MTIFFLVLSKNQWRGPHETWAVLSACSRRRNSFGDTGKLYRKNGLWEDSWKMRTILICRHEVRHSWGSSRTNKTQHTWKLLDVVRGKRLRKGETGELGGKKKTGLDQTQRDKHQPKELSFTYQTVRLLLLWYKLTPGNLLLPSYSTDLTLNCWFILTLVRFSLALAYVSITWELVKN